MSTVADGERRSTVADIVRSLPMPLGDVDTSLVLTPGARSGDIVVPPLPDHVTIPPDPRTRAD